MRNAFGSWLAAKARDHSDLVLLSGDIGFGIFDEFREDFPDRFVNCGIAEQNMIGTAAGMAAHGLRPIVYTIIPFLLHRPYEFIKNLIGHQCQPVLLVGVGGGLAYDKLGFTHFAREDLILAATIPNLQIFIPYDPASVPTLCQAALSQKKPVYIRLMKGGESVIKFLREELPGAEHFAGKTQEYAFVTYGSTTELCIMVREELATSHNVHGSVFAITDPSRFDPNILDGFKAIVLVEEQVYPGISSHIFHKNRLPENLKMVHLDKNREYTVGSRDEILARDGISREGLSKIVLETLRQK